MILKQRYAVILFSIMHLLFDGLCAYLIFSSLYQGKSYIETFIVFLIYNGLAFCLQIGIGALIDKCNSPQLFLIIALILLVLAVILKNIYILSTILLGLANAFFHISGGKYTIESSNNNIIDLGLFVAPGAIGLMLGQLFPTKLLFTIMFIILAIGVIIISISKLEYKEKVITIEKPLLNKEGIIYIILLMFIVLLRGLGGKIVPTNATLSTVILLMASIFIAFGKFMGGVFAYKVGYKWTIIISMALSVLFLFLGLNNKYLYLVGLFFFNFTMPITLYMLVSVLNNKPGLAFGMLAAMLFPGYLIGMIVFNTTIKVIIYTTICIISATVLYILNRRIKNVS